jgi:aminopeptidase-like protein
MAVAVHLAQILSRWPRRHTYRFLFLPGTIGAITWLALHREQLQAIQGGLVLACAGDRGHLHYKRSRQGSSEVDRAVEQVLGETAPGATINEFTPFGYDERQYCSPGINLAVGSLTRTPSGQYPEYHTSADNLDLMDPDSLADTLATCVSICAILEHNRIHRNRQPFCEPQLGKRNLYRSLGGTSDVKRQEQAILWILNLADGEHDLLDMARRSKLPFADLVAGVRALSEHELLDTSDIGRVADRDGYVNSPGKG